MLGGAGDPRLSMDHLNRHLQRRSWAFLFIAALGGLWGIRASTSSPSSSPSPSQVLQLNGFPPGLLPDTVVSGSCNSNGRFEVQLRRKCFLNIPGAYPVRYDVTIKGLLSKGRLSDLSGVSVKVLFVWWPITSISVEGPDLVFSVDFASAAYPATNFMDSPVCGDSIITPLHSFA